MGVPSAVDARYAYAGLWVRILAFALDYVVISVYLFLLAVVAVLLNQFAPGLLPSLFNNALSAHAASFLIVTLPVILYFALLESSSWQATLGKRVMGLQLVRINGARLTFGRALARTILQFIPWELAHTLIWQVRFDPAGSPALITAGFVVVWLLVGVNLISLWLTPTHQTLYDKIAGTFVIRRDAASSTEYKRQLSTQSRI